MCSRKYYPYVAEEKYTLKQKSTSKDGRKFLPANKNLYNLVLKVYSKFAKCLCKNSVKFFALSLIATQRKTNVPGTLYANVDIICNSSHKLTNMEN